LEAGWNNKAVCEVVEENDKVRILKCTFAPDVGHEKHYHNPHFGYTQITSHEVLNIGDSTAVFLIVEYK